MKLLLTSGGVSNPSILEALVDLLGKPIDECDALCTPTAIYGIPGMAASAWRLIGGRAKTPLVELGWKSVGVLELTALPSMERDGWTGELASADVLLVGGGDAAYLAHWVRASGLLELFPTLVDKVWVGVSGGSLVMAPRIGDDFVQWQSPDGDRTLGIVDFAMFPHLDHPNLPENTMADAEAWAATLDIPAYAIDDATAIRVVDGTAEVISEGHWKLFNA